MPFLVAHGSTRWKPADRMSAVQLRRSVFLKVKTRCVRVEVHRDVVRPRQAVRRHAYIPPPWLQCAEDLSQMFESVVGVQVLEDLV